MRPRPAPIAARTASSRRRAAARASNRFATFEHAINSTSMTPAIIRYSTSVTSLGMKRLMQSANVRRPTVVGCRVVLVQSAAMPIEIFRRMCLGHTGLQPAEGKQIALVTGPGSKQEARAESTVAGSLETRIGRHDADDRVRLTVDLDAAPEDAGIGSIPDRPEVVAKMTTPAAFG